MIFETKQEVMKYINEVSPGLVLINEGVYHITVRDNKGEIVHQFRATDFSRNKIGLTPWEKII